MSLPTRNFRATTGSTLKLIVEFVFVCILAATVNYAISRIVGRWHGDRRHLVRTTLLGSAFIVAFTRLIDPIFKCQERPMSHR